MKRIYFSDFDGTITQRDTTNALTRAFAQPGWEESLLLWERGELTTLECSRQLFKGFRATPDELAQYLRAIPIDQSFADFVHYVEARGEKLYILSDGYDFNIRLILDQAGLGHIKFYSNRLLMDHGYSLETPYANEACGRHGTCKKALIQTLKEEGDQIVYIGDGHSDACASQEANLIFAKDYLLKYGLAHTLPVQPFETFSDILTKLREIDAQP